jgi:hypothetical protein
MKKRRRIKASMGLELVAVAALVVALLLAMPPTEARAQVTCPTASTADSDGDGFSDTLECTGITLNLGTAAPTTFVTDPNVKDLFVIMVPANSSLIPTNPYQFITAPKSADGVTPAGLGIAVHEISANQAAADRTLVSGVSAKAVKITENLSTDGTALGQSNQGIALDLATVFTQRIANLINSVCDATIPDASCVDSNSATNGVIGRTAVREHFIRHTIAHEGCGHSCDIAPEYNSRFGGNHYKAGSLVVMEQNVTYSKKGTKVTWYISNLYPGPDQAAASPIP